MKKDRDEDLIGRHMLRFTQSLTKIGRVTLVEASFTIPYIPMINSISIENFKGMRHCEIKDLGKVNLFIGRNSCGKSTIMEAAYFTGKEFLGANLPECIMRRANRGAWSARELWYGYNTISSEVKVRMIFNEGDSAGMRLQFSEHDKRIREYLFTANEKSEEFAHEYQVASFGHTREGRIPPLKNEIREYFDKSCLIDPAIKTNVMQIEGNYLNILKLSEDDSSDLARRTSEIYDTKASWEFLPHQDFSPSTPSRFAILEGKRRLFFDNFGDGLHYGLAILAIAKTRKNTALFIEEIESHQHPEAIKSLISNLLSIAKTNNLQLFITTHSDYARDYLYYYYKSPEERKRDFRCFHVLRNKDTGEVNAKIEEGIINITEDLHGRPT
jgi:hypothetical protein